MDNTINVTTGGIRSKSHWFTFGSHLLYMRESGPVDPCKIGIVFVHGAFSAGNVWGPIQERLQSTFRCFVPDLPGFGRSVSTFGKKLTLQEQVSVLESLADFLTKSCERLIWIGQDLGASLVEAYSLRPGNRVSAMVLLNPTSLTQSWPFRTGWRGFLLRWTGWRLARESSRVAQQWEEQLVDAWINRQSSRTMIESVQGIEQTWPNAEERARSARQLREARCPALLLFGTRGRVVRRDSMIDLMRNRPDLSFSVREKGHWIGLEEPDWIAHQVREFQFRLQAAWKETRKEGRRTA